ncbi:MAG: hypoxanthine phosphoribosyltransferase [Rhodothermales bacterium]|nr:hypoxanthine phosphoribosyltransferase [Rhodothermales bacterium]
MSETEVVGDKQTITCLGEQFRVYIDRDRIQERVTELGRQISEDYAGKKPVLIGVLNGAFMFLADLMRSISIDCEVDFIKLSSYGAQKITSGVVHELKKIDAEITGRHVIVVEDIVDTGLSMSYLMEKMSSHRPASVTAATLLHKHEATKVDINLKYVGFKIKNLFVIGYGLDYGQLARNYPDIYILDEEVDA